MHTVELLYYIFLTCLYGRPEDGIYPSVLRKSISTFFGYCLISTISSVPRNDDGSREHLHDFLRSICGSYVYAEIWLMTPFHMNIHLIGSFS